MYFKKPKDFHFIIFPFPKRLFRDNEKHFLSTGSQIQKGLLSLPGAFSCQHCSCQTQSLSAICNTVWTHITAGATAHCVLSRDEERFSHIYFQSKGRLLPSGSDNADTISSIQSLVLIPGTALFYSSLLYF